MHDHLIPCLTSHRWLCCSAAPHALALRCDMPTSCVVPRRSRPPIGLRPPARHMPAAGTCGVEARLVSNFVRFSTPLIRAAHWRSAMRCPCWRRARRPGQPPLVNGARAYTADFDARLLATSGGRAARTTPYLGRWCGYNFAMAAQQSRTTDHSLPARVRLMCTTAVDACAAAYPTCVSGARRMTRNARPVGFPAILRGTCS